MKPLFKIEGICICKQGLACFEKLVLYARSTLLIKSVFGFSMLVSVSGVRVCVCWCVCVSGVRVYVSGVCVFFLLLNCFF